jgi:hypothetical protein
MLVAWLRSKRLVELIHERANASPGQCHEARQTFAAATEGCWAIASEQLISAIGVPHKEIRIAKPDHRGHHRAPADARSDKETD